MATITTDMDTNNQTQPPSPADTNPVLEPLPESTTKDLVQLFKLLSDETRLQTLHFLRQKGELNVRTLCQLLGQSQPSVSHHLALLRVARLIDMRRDGKHNFYRILPERFDELVTLVISAIPNVAKAVESHPVLGSAPPTDASSSLP